MWIVRYVVEGFVEKEKFESKKEAKKFYDDRLIKLGDYLLEIDMYKI